MQVSPTHVQKLSEYAIPWSAIALQETVGQGMQQSVYLVLYLYDDILGEFGVVYRALLSIENGAPQPVAVKTLKGIDSSIHCHLS